MDKSTSTNNNQLVMFIASAVIVMALVILFANAYLNRQAADSNLSSSDFKAGNVEVATIPDGIGGLQVGNLAPEFNVFDLDGKEVALSDFKGQAVMVNFWASWCAPCRIEMPEMERAYEQYKDQGFVILALNQDESPDVVEDFFYNEMGLSFTPLLDENSVIANDFGVYGFNPSSFFIDRDGVITARHIGPLTAGQLDSFITDILSTQ